MHAIEPRSLVRAWSGNSSCTSSSSGLCSRMTSSHSSWTLSSSSGRSRTTFFLRPLVHSFCGNNLCARCHRATSELQQLMCARRRRAIDTHSRHRSTATRVRLKWQQLVNGTIERRSLVQYIFLRPLVQQLMHAVNERRPSGNSLCSRCR